MPVGNQSQWKVANIISGSPLERWLWSVTKYVSLASQTSHVASLVLQSRRQWLTLCLLFSKIKNLNLLIRHLCLVYSDDIQQLLQRGQYSSPLSIFMNLWFFLTDLLRLCHVSLVISYFVESSLIWWFNYLPFIKYFMLDKWSISVFIINILLWMCIY